MVYWGREYSKRSWWIIGAVRNFIDHIRDIQEDFHFTELKQLFQKNSHWKFDFYTFPLLTCLIYRKSKTPSQQDNVIPHRLCHITGFQSKNATYALLSSLLPLWTGSLNLCPQAKGMTKTAIVTVSFPHFPTNLWCHKRSFNY